MSRAPTSRWDGPTPTGDISGNVIGARTGHGGKVPPVYATWPHTNVMFGSIAVSPRRIFNQQITAIEPQLFIPIHHDPCAFDVKVELDNEIDDAARCAEAACCGTSAIRATTTVRSCSTRRLRPGIKSRASSCSDPRSICTNNGPVCTTGHLAYKVILFPSLPNSVFNS